MGRPQVLPAVGQVQMPLPPGGQPTSGGPDHRQPSASSPGQTCNQPQGLWTRAASLRKRQEAPVDSWDSLPLPEQGTPAAQ